MRMPWIALGALLLMGCAGEESDFLDAPPDDPVTTPVVSTSAPPPTTMVTTTAAPTTVPPTTIAPATTVPEPTTTLSLEDQVRAGVVANQVARHICRASPTTCDVSTIAVADSPDFIFLSQKIDERVSKGYYVLDRPESTYVVRSVTMGSDATSARIDLCSFDADWLMDWRDPEISTDDVLVDDSIVTWITDLTMVLTDTGWRSFDERLIEQVDGENRCVA